MHMDAETKLYPVFKGFISGFIEIYLNGVSGVALLFCFDCGIDCLQTGMDFLYCHVI